MEGPINQRESKNFGEESSKNAFAKFAELSCSIEPDNIAVEKFRNVVGF